MTTGDKRAEMSLVRGYEEHSLKTFQNNGESLGKCHLGTVSTLSWPEGLYFSPALGARVGGRPKSFPENCLLHKQLSRSHPTQSGISCPLFGLYYPISLLHWVISFLYRGMFLGPWGHFLPAYCLPPPLTSFWVPGRAVGVLRVHVTSQQELAGTQPLEPQGSAGPAVTACQFPGIAIFQEPSPSGGGGDGGRVAGGRAPGGCYTGPG